MDPGESDDPHQSNDNPIAAEVIDLSNLIGPCRQDVKDDLSVVLQKLREMQEKEPLIRFHLFLDKDYNAPPQQAAASNIRIMHSPTISLSNTRQNMLIHSISGLIALLNELSAEERPQQAENAGPGEPSARVPTGEAVPAQTTQPTRPPAAIIATLPTDDRENLRLFSSLCIPQWYPGSQHKLTAETHQIPITTDIILKFKLPDKKLRWLYGFFFKQANLTTTAHASTTAKFKGVYKQFTAPWFFGDFIVDNNRVYRDSVVSVQNVKQFRNNSGSRIIAFTLAAFYVHEKTFCQQPLDYMLRHINDLMALFPSHKLQMESEAPAPMTVPPITRLSPAELPPGLPDSASHRAAPVESPTPHGIASLRAAVPVDDCAMEDSQQDDDSVDFEAVI